MKPPGKLKDQSAHARAPLESHEIQQECLTKVPIVHNVWSSSGGLTNGTFIKHMPSSHTPPPMEGLSGPLFSPEAKKVGEVPPSNIGGDGVGASFGGVLLNFECLTVSE